MEQPPAQHQCQAEHGEQARHRQESKERRRRERLKCLHLVVAVLMMILLASLVVGLRVNI